MSLLLDAETRRRIWRQVGEALERYLAELPEMPVAPPLDPADLRRRLAGFDFSRPLSPDRALAFAVEQLRTRQVHVGHPGYYGLYNPAPTAMGIAADALVAGFNPQLAAWSHSPFAAEVERHLVRAFGERFGYAGGEIDGAFCSGGMEANHTAVLAALTRAFPAFAEKGVRALPGDPVLYVTGEAHDSFRKAARLCGLGAAAAQAVATDGDLRMDPQALAERIAADRAAGRAPFLAVATLGTTSAGILDPVADIAGVAADADLWCHADAAWGGAAVLDPDLAPALAGIERADSITLDAHKWLSAPMAAGIFITRHPDILERTFRVGQSYMPRDSAHLDVHEPFARSMQWSRRFTGLKVFLALAVAGWDGYRDEIHRMHLLGERLKSGLMADGWKIVNRTPLPLACFVDTTRPDGRKAGTLQRIAAHVMDSGRSWVSTPVIGGDRTVIRACISSHRTREADVEILLSALDEARAALPISPSAPGPGPG